MDNVLDKNIVFLTTTIGTKWIFYQQYLLNKFFPEAKKVVIDGNQRWDFGLGRKCVWYDFIEIALAHKDTHTYFIHIDEDCFVTNPQAIYDSIKLLEKGECHLIGPSDVAESIRAQNPLALNSFFMMGDIQTLDHVMKHYDISLSFQSLDISKGQQIEESKIENEPYYPFFWNYYKMGFKLGFISTGFHKEFICTTLLDLKGESFAYHMWFTRKWYSRKSTPWGPSHYERYKRVQNNLDEKFDISFWKVVSEMKLWNEYFRIQFSRLFLKNIMRIKKRILFFNK